MRKSTFLLLLPLLLLACSDDPAGPSEPEWEYLAYAHADADSALAHLVENLRLAFERMDLAEYRDEILYDGVAPAADGEVYAGYTFYYDPNAAEGQPYELPDTDELASELGRVGRMFAGDPGEDFLGNEVPGIRSIDFGLLAQGIWTAPASDSVETDPYPPGTLERFYETDLMFWLDSIYGEHYIAFRATDRLRFHAIPVDAGAGLLRYRLWKWRDVVSFKRATDSSSYSLIKALYRED